MSDHSRRRIAGSGLAAALLALAGCTSSHGGSTQSTTPAGTTSSPTGTSTAAPTTDQLKKYLIPAKDITGDKYGLTSTSPVSQNSAVGISGVFTNAHDNRVINVIVVRFPSTADAQAGLSATQQLAAQQITQDSTGSKSVPVGQLAQLYEGSNGTGPLAILVYTEGRYVVSMQFLAKTAADTIPDSVIVAAGTAQDAEVKTAP